MDELEKAISYLEKGDEVEFKLYIHSLDDTTKKAILPDIAKQTSLSYQVSRWIVEQKELFSTENIARYSRHKELVKSLTESCFNSVRRKAALNPVLALEDLTRLVEEKPGDKWVLCGILANPNCTNEIAEKLSHCPMRQVSSSAHSWLAACAR